MKVEGIKVLLTGATSGIGEALLMRLVANGNIIIAVGRDQSKLQQLEQYPKVISYSCDLTSPDSVQQLANFVVSQHSDLNLLINNAGIQHNYSFDANNAVSASLIQEELQVNLLAPIHLTSLLMPILRANKNAAIVNITSALGRVPKHDAAVYSSSKAGLSLFTKSLRLQSNAPLIVEAIPPLVETRMTSGRGRGKISADACAMAIMKGLEKNQTTIAIGKIKALFFIQRFWPALAERLINRPA